MLEKRAVKRETHGRNERTGHLHETGENMQSRGSIPRYGYPWR